MKTKKRTEEQSMIDLLDQQYLEADNKEDIDYWAPLAQIIMESIALRDAKDMTQADLAQKMKTRQSVISRFENMGRLPNYKFFAKLALALGHAPGMTLYGDYMAVVPPEKQVWVREKAARESMPTQKLVQNLLNQQLVQQQAQQTSDATASDNLPSDVGNSQRTNVHNMVSKLSTANCSGSEQMSDAA